MVQRDMAGTLNVNLTIAMSGHLQSLFTTQWSSIFSLIICAMNPPDHASLNI